MIQMSVLKIIWPKVNFLKEQRWKILWYYIYNFLPVSLNAPLDSFPPPTNPGKDTSTFQGRKTQLCYLTIRAGPHRIKQISPFSTMTQFSCRTLQAGPQRNKISKPSNSQDKIKFLWWMKGVGFSKSTSLNFILSSFLSGNSGVLIRLWSKPV